MEGLKGVIEGKLSRPRRTLIYGQHGIGKTLWASKAPNPIIIQTEEGADDIGTPRFPVCQNMEQFWWCYRQLMGVKGEPKTHDRESVIVDSADWLETLQNKQVCEELGINSLDDWDYGRAYTIASLRWKKLLHSMLELQKERGMNIIFIAHSKVVEFKDPTRDSYMRYTNALHTNGKGAGAGKDLQEWCDEVLFMTYKVNVRLTDKKLGKEEKKAVGGGDRALYTEERPTHDAKNRLDLDYEIPMDKDLGYNGVYATGEEA